MQMPKQVKHSRSLLGKCLWWKERAGELGRLGEAASIVLSHPKWRKEKGRKALQNHPLGLCAAQGRFCGAFREILSQFQPSRKSCVSGMYLGIPIDATVEPGMARGWGVSGVTSQVNSHSDLTLQHCTKQREKGQLQWPHPLSYWFETEY